MMKQSAFSKLIGVSRKTVTVMKKNGEIVMKGDLVDSKNSILKLKSLGREFDKNNKLIKKSEHTKEVEKTEDHDINIFSSEVVPEKNLSNMSDRDREEREKLLREAAALRMEVESENNNSEDSVNHNTEIDKLDFTGARLIKEYWLGVSLRQKTELVSGELLYKKDIYAALFDLARQVRDKLESRPNMAFKMVGKNIHEIEDILEKEKEEILNILGEINVS